MSAKPVPALLAAFTGAEPLTGAVDAARAAGAEPLDAFTPYPIEGLAERLTFKPKGVRMAMACGGLGVAAAFYLTEWWSTTHGYAFNSGGRPTHSWPAFLISPVELGILAAAITGFATVLIQTGLPRLNHPLFDRTAFERASQDQFLLAVARPQSTEAAGAVRRALFDAGAVWVEEAQL